jgi:hypothetical protein
MDLLSLIPDNITELLIKIVRFTELRRCILHRNVHHADSDGFVPQDMPVREFAQLLNDAVAEHLRTQRLLFRDTAGICFGPSGEMRVRPVRDAHAYALLQSDRDAYMELQVNKLLENALNRKVAEELLRQKYGICPNLVKWGLGPASVDENPLENSSAQCDTAE